MPSSNPKNGTGWRDIVSTGGAFSPSYVGEALARDARLIASAPDLLAALKLALSNLEKIAPRLSPYSGEGCNADLADRAIDVIREAIAKAIGGSNT